MEVSDAAKLREPFPPEQIGKLPRATDRNNKVGKCDECGLWHKLPAVHLDYAGHAAVTNRLLQVDPLWTWEPMATDEHGLPILDARGGLWIRLTVCGHTRPGYGDETNGKGMKEIIGDAIRNAAMRFGVALDLWSKQELSGFPEHEDSGNNGSKPLEITAEHITVLRDYMLATESDEVKFCAVFGIEKIEHLPDDKFQQAVDLFEKKMAKMQAQA